MKNLLDERKNKFQALKAIRDRIAKKNAAVKKIYTPEMRIKDISDRGSFRAFKFDFRADDPLKFPDYENKIEEVRKYTGENEAVTAGTCTIEGSKAVMAVMDRRFLMGSMGIAVGETITRTFEYAEEHRLPCIIFTASGGARMQEGMFSLMQMAKTAAAAEKYKNSGGLYIACLTHPTTGGVSASFASLGDITLAEPGALICFAGPRVIEQTIGQALPKGFQRAEYLEEHGAVDCIVKRDEMKAVLAQLLRLHGIPCDVGNGR